MQYGGRNIHKFQIFENTQVQNGTLKFKTEHSNPRNTQVQNLIDQYKQHRDKWDRLMTSNVWVEGNSSHGSKSPPESRWQR